jgi:hypothetical protein
MYWHPAAVVIGSMAGFGVSVVVVSGTAHWVAFWRLGRAADTRTPFLKSGLLVGQALLWSHG